MLKKSLPIFIFLITFGLAACGGKNPSKVSSADQTPNIRSFPIPYQKMWKITLDTVEFDFLMGIELKDMKKGFFSTEIIRDYQPFQKRRFRLSGTLLFDGKETMVKLYKHEEMLIDNEWKAIPSNSTFEKQVLNRIAQRAH